MAKTNTVTLTLKGKKITAEKLMKSLEAFYGFMNEIASEVSGKKKPIKWIVSAKSGSIIIANTPEFAVPIMPDVTDKIFGTIVNGIDSLRKTPQRPEYFSDDALEYLQKLYIPRTKGNGLDKVSIVVNRKTRTLSKNIMNNVDSLLGEYSHAIGSIEGFLEAISISGGGNKLFIHEILTNRAIRCDTNEEIMLKALDKEIFGKKVIVSGIISYDKDNSPKRIRVNELDVLNKRGSKGSILRLCGVLG